jgi:hypothetical protein
MFPPWSVPLAGVRSTPVMLNVSLLWGSLLSCTRTSKVHGIDLLMVQVPETTNVIMSTLRTFHR